MTVAGFALAAAAGWVLWLGWRTPYVVVDGRETGPYTAFEVVGLVLTLLVLMVAGSLLLGPRWVGTGLVLGLVLTAYADWSGTDDTGQSGVGVLLLAVGATVVAYAVGRVVTAARRRPENERS